MKTINTFINEAIINHDLTQNDLQQYFLLVPIGGLVYKPLKEYNDKDEEGLFIKGQGNYCGILLTEMYAKKMFENSGYYKLKEFKGCKVFEVLDIQELFNHYKNNTYADRDNSCLKEINYDTFIAKYGK